MRGSSRSDSILVDPQPSRAISRVRAVSPSLGGATSSSHLRNSFGLPHSGVPQCDVCPFLLLLHSESADLPPGCSLASLVGWCLRGSRLFFSALDRNEDTPDFVLPCFRVFTMGSPFSGRGSNFMIAHSIGMKSLAEPGYQVLRDEVALWIGCGPWSTLDLERRFSLVFGLSFFRMGSPF